MRRKSSFNRRGFLKGAALGAAAVAINPILSLRRVAGAATGGIPGRFMVVINMFGGNDGLNMVVPTHLTPYIDRRPNINLVDNLPAGQVLKDLSSGFKLHYELENIKAAWDNNDLHVINKVSYPTPNQSHFTSMDIMATGVRDFTEDGDGRGWLGRFADLYCSNPVEPLGVVSVGVGKRLDFDSDVTQPLIIGSSSTVVPPLSGFTVDNSEDTKAGEHDLRVKIVRDAIGTDPVPVADPSLTIFNTTGLAYDLVSRVQEETVDWIDPGTYPNTTLGRNLRVVSALLEGRAAFGTKVFYTGMGGFDTHSAEETRHASLMNQLDEAFGAFTQDLKDRNLWNDCVVVVISEFGRRVFENGSLGTDHGHGGAFFVLGGRVKGKNDAGSGLTMEIVESDIATNNTLPFAADFRDIYGSIFQDFIGVQPAGIFPDPDYTPDLANFDLIA